MRAGLLRQVVPVSPVGDTLRSDDDMVAGQWCKIPGSSDDWDTGIERVPPAPDTSNGSDGAVRDQELATLGKLKTATGFIGDYALARAKTTPKDPDLPWLLHVVVASTKGGCLDPDAKTLSKAAFTLLHTRYKNSQWADATPYYY